MSCRDSWGEDQYLGLVVQEWFAFFMHGGAATAQVEAASQAVRAALLQPALVAAFAEWVMVAASSTPAVLSARIAAERQNWGPISRLPGFRSNELQSESAFLSHPRVQLPWSSAPTPQNCPSNVNGSLKAGMWVLSNSWFGCDCDDGSRCSSMIR